jgi:uroporphyrinogen III methyltransferase / synthase
VPIELPTIRTQLPDDVSGLDHAITSLGRYAWAVFTSANGVRFVADRSRALGVEPARLSSLQIAAIGPSTARALSEHGVRVDLVPPRAVAESLVEAMRTVDLVGKRVLLPVARDARDIVAAGLSARGAIVDRIVAYETYGASDPWQARQLVVQSEVITLTSSSTAQRLAELLGDDRAELTRPIAVASIGPVTSQTAREQGFVVGIEASEHTIVGLISAIEEWAASRDR